MIWWHDKKHIGQKWHPWESLKAKTTADQKEQACLTFAKKDILKIPKTSRKNIL